jgi:hypothetical protein
VVGPLFSGIEGSGAGASLFKLSEQEDGSGGTWKDSYECQSLSQTFLQKIVDTRYFHQLDRCMGIVPRIFNRMIAKDKVSSIPGKNHANIRIFFGYIVCGKSYE